MKYSCKRWFISNVSSKPFWVGFLALKGSLCPASVAGSHSQARRKSSQADAYIEEERLAEGQRMA